MTEGTLIVNKNNLQIKFINKNGKEVSPNVKESELSAPILARKKNAIAQLNGLEVELEEVGGQPKQIREKGQKWQAPNVQTPTQKTNKNPHQKQPPKPQRSPENQALRSNTQNIKGEFHNPYNFIPAPTRNTEHSELGDHLPKGHGCYHQDYWSGRISVTLETITPLLIPDAANATEDNKKHKTYPIRLDAQGNPYLPPTSIKGMLRSAYEAVTNSRFGIFEKHDDRLAYRTPAKITVVPARVEKRQGQLYLRIMDEIGGTAKLPRYDKRSSKQDKGQSYVALKYDGTKNLPQHGDQVWVKLNKGKVTNICKWDNCPPSLIGWKQGWVCVTGANINGKMNERVFIENNDNDFIPVNDKIKSLWEELIRNYQETHEKDLKKRSDNKQSPQAYLGDEPGKTAWSRHIWDKNESKFQEGTLCYVELKNDDEVIAIQPVTISRRLYKLAPNQLLHPSLKPATSIDELSPAERVFGWVKQDKQNQQKGANSYKGNLRIFNVTCKSEKAITSFGDNGFPLAILGKPNEQQARFYQAKDEQGNPLDNNVNKEEAYASEGQGLRGRKVYPHHNGLPNDHWDDPNSYRQEANNGHHQEYRQPIGENEKTDQNRSIKAWVKPQVQFEFTLDVINLSPVELGALLWLLSLGDNYYHRLGGGKPLGFGSVQLSINWDKTDLRIGQDWQRYYNSLLPIELPDAKLAESCVNKFKQAVKEAYGNGGDFAQVSFIQAFTIAAQGFKDKLPIHYPRISKDPNPNGEGFDWFVDNERVGKEGRGFKLSLPFLIDDKGLPYQPKIN